MTPLSAERRAEIDGWIDTFRQVSGQLPQYVAAGISACEDLRAEVERLNGELSRERCLMRLDHANLRHVMVVGEHDIEQILGRALGMPRFCDDQKNWPGATDAAGVCVGEHTAVTLAMTARDELRSRTRDIANLRGKIEAAKAVLQAMVRGCAPGWEASKASEALRILG